MPQLDMQDAVGGILFENIPGNYFTRTVGAVMLAPDPNWLENMKEMMDES